MATPFQNYVNDELPRRVSVTELPEGGNFPAGRNLVTTGVGIGVEIGDATVVANFYVNADTGDDDTGDGSILNPWKTCQKAVNEAILVMSSTKDFVQINLTPNTTSWYRGASTAETTAVGGIYIVGDKFEPENCIVSNAGTSFLHDSPGLTLYVDGCRIVGGVYGVHVKRGVFIEGFNEFLNNTQNILVEERGIFYAPQDIDGDTTLTTSLSLNSINLYAKSGSVVIIGQQFEYFGAVIPLKAESGAIVQILEGANQSMHSSIGGVAGMQAIDSIVDIGADITVDLGSASGNAALNFINSKWTTSQSININVSNATYALVLAKGANVRDANTTTFVLGEGVSIGKMEHGCILNTSNTYAQNLELDEPTQTYFGYDDRYLQYNISNQVVR